MIDKEDENATGKGLENSLFSVVATEHGTVIGFGRIIGDGGLYFYIQDLIVHPEFQAKGLGKILMKELKSYITAKAKTGAFVGLMAAKGLKNTMNNLVSKLVIKMPQECI